MSGIRLTVLGTCVMALALLGTTTAHAAFPGPNGTGYASCPPTCGDGDETVFMRQGIFVP